MAAKRKANNVFSCSFCGKNQTEVRKLVAGPDVCICDECVILCTDIISETASLGDDNQKEGLTPQRINNIMDDYVIGQKHAKKVLSVTVYNHRKRVQYQQDDDAVELSKSNVVLIGPTGSGKTLLAETLARLLDVPFIIADATTLTEAGYVGEDVESVLQRLLQKCDYDVEKAESGIIYIDEIDKISRKSDNPSITRDVSGEGVQQALLKLIESTIASVPVQGSRKHPQQECVKINTKNILFICGGAFDGLEKIIERRVRTTHGSIGFSADIRSEDNKQQINEVLQQIESEDLLSYGLIPELVGRLPVLATLEELDEAQMLRILTEPKNALVKQYTQLFAMDKCAIEFHADALTAIVRKAKKRKTGARGLRSIMESVLLNTMYELPSKEDVTKVIVDSQVVESQADPLIVYESGSQRQLIAER